MNYVIKNVNEFDQDLINTFYPNVYYQKKMKTKKRRNKKTSIIGEILLSNLLNEYNINYNDLIFKVNSFGKPYIVNVPIYFNISHSFDYVIVTTSDKEIGIDIEKIRKVNINTINYFATDNEKKYILSSKKNVEERLFKIYTLKEAYFKMKGTNLDKVFDVEFTICNSDITCNDKNVNLGFINTIDGYCISYCERNK